MPHATGPVPKAIGAVEPLGAHPLAASVATVDLAVRSLSFRLADRMSDEPRSDEPGSGCITCENTLSDPDFFMQRHRTDPHFRHARPC